MDGPAGDLEHFLLGFEHVELEVGSLVLVQEIVRVVKAGVVGVAVGTLGLDHGGR